MKYLPINAELFAENRKRFVAKMKPNSVAVFHSNDQMPRTADQYHKYRENSDFFYLTGIDQEDSMLVLCPDDPNPKFREALFLKETSEHIAIWEGHKYTKQEAKQTSGIDNVRWNDIFLSQLKGWVLTNENIYVNLNENARAIIDVPYKDVRFAHYLREHYPAHNLERAGPIMADLRMIKSSIELDLLQTCCDITGKAFDRVMKFVEPGVWEYEIEAEITHEFLRNRATGPGYESIIATGKNACVLHYVDNNMQCKSGDLLLMDFGAEYANYNADLSRTIPVSGTFTPRQKDVYNAVLRVMKEATNMLRPGTLLEDYTKEVGKVAEMEMVQLGLLKASDVKNQDPEKPLYKKYLMHGISHHLGLDVHDIGKKTTPIAPGMVFTVEPGFYIPEEDMGIRIENDVVVTADAPKDLMGHIPREIEEIEEVMNAKVTV